MDEWQAAFAWLLANRYFDISPYLRGQTDFGDGLQGETGQMSAPEALHMRVGGGRLLGHPSVPPSCYPISQTGLWARGQVSIHGPQPCTKTILTVVRGTATQT